MMMSTAKLLSRMVLGEKVLDGLECLYDEPGAELIRKAWAFSERINEGKFSKSGELFIKRLQRCACALIYLEADAETVTASLLANVFEDTEIQEEEIEETFSKTVLHHIKKANEAQMILTSNKPEEEKINQLKAMDEKSISIFLTQRYEEAASQVYYMPSDTWNIKCKENNSVCIPVAEHFSMKILADGISFFSTPYEEDEEETAISEDTISNFFEELLDSETYSIQKEQLLEEEKRIKEKLSKYPNVHNSKTDVVLSQLRDIDHLAKNYIEQKKYKEAIEEYEKIKSIIIERFSCDIEQYYYWLTLASLSEGRAYWAAKNEAATEKLFLEAKDYCETLEEETGKVDLILRDNMLYPLAVFYSFYDTTYSHSEELMAEVRDIRKMLWEMSTDKSKERLNKLIEIHTPLIDLARWQDKNPEEYIREKEKYEKILEQMDSDAESEST